ncbi:GumK N-terminal domain-containing glycosyltransferase [Ramlibacter sp. Leaf400]|uniref:GumK N-terminal domain-containing glycosyltransferase n=1 Tax=Ramlibacter sp. Leaf400 TaxID=1736365 RepID=UPI0012E3D9E8|nr:hypothetical protein [Ramlibacter sp. Leaf400]
MTDKTIVFLTTHLWKGQRKAGFHFLASAFSNLGWHVKFVTTGISLISNVAQDRRSREVESSGSDGIVEWFVEKTTAHPVDLRLPWLNALTAPLFLKYYGRRPSKKLEEAIRQASHVVFESSCALFYVNTVCRLNASATLIYRVSDDVRVIKNHPAVRTVEDQIIERFDCISIPSSILHKRRFSGYPTAHIHLHGLDTAALDIELPSPYTSRRPIAVYVGSTLYDNNFLQVAHQQFSGIDFHVVGNIEPTIRSANVFYHGEMAFNQAVQFMKHADIGLALYRRQPGAEYLAESSNKIAQFMYLGLPVITPDFVGANLTDHRVLCYTPNESETIQAAMQTALDMPKGVRGNIKAKSWLDVATDIFECASAR